MNYMNKIAKMLGVAIGERFDLKNAHNYIINDCCLDNNGLRNNRSILIESDFADILTGNAEIIKKPFRPKFGDTYYTIKYCGNIEFTKYEGVTIDLMAVYMGNCFRTEAEAEAHKDEIMAKFREVMNNDRA